MNASGFSCTSTTSAIENALGKVENQEFLPEYYEGEENFSAAEKQSIKQK
ncbi:MAG: DUF2997 domain-containing protein [Heteroscytonema crispum UTEX LB 1556]